MRTLHPIIASAFALAAPLLSPAAQKPARGAEPSSAGAYAADGHNLDGDTVTDPAGERRDPARAFVEEASRALGVPEDVLTGALVDGGFPAPDIYFEAWIFPDGGEERSEFIFFFSPSTLYPFHFFIRTGSPGGVSFGHWSWEQHKDDEGQPHPCLYSIKLFSPAFGSEFLWDACNPDAVVESDYECENSRGRVKLVPGC